MERITAAAIRIGPCVYTGPHHATIIHYVSRCAGMKPVTGEQGFLTDAGRFVGRGEAAFVALRAGQADPARVGPYLMSEDLWIVPDAERRVQELEASIADHFQRDHLEGDGPEIDRWRRAVGEALEEAAKAIEATDFAGDEWSAKVFAQAKLTFAAKVRALKATAAR